MIMDNLEDVEDLTSLWNFDESIDDLKKQLQCVMNELAKARQQAIKQAKINKENVKKLVHLLGIAYKERDDAKEQLHKLLMVKPHTLPTSSLSTVAATTTTINETNKSGLTSSSKTALPINQQPPPTINPCWNLSSSEAPTLPNMMKNNLITTNYSNTPSSSMDLYFDLESSVEVYNMSNNSSNANNASSSYDQISTILDNLAKGRPRPEKGKLLQSVMEAGPLLDSLLVAGSLPTWSSPPQIADAPQVPPVPISMSKRLRYNETLEY